MSLPVYARADPFHQRLRVPCRLLLARRFLHLLHRTPGVPVGHLLSGGMPSVHSRRSLTAALISGASQVSSVATGWLGLDEHMETFRDPGDDNIYAGWGSKVLEQILLSSP